MPLTHEQQKQYLAEALDPNKVTLHCAKHMYFGPSSNQAMKPAKGCSNCWMVFYVHDLASAPPHMRAQRLDELDEVLHKVVEKVESGQWDVVINPHADIKIESE